MAKPNKNTRQTDTGGATTWWTPPYEQQMYRGYNPRDIRNTGLTKNVTKPMEDWAASIVNKTGDWIGDAFQSVVDRLANQKASGYSYPIAGTTAPAPPKFNTSKEPARSVHGVQSSMEYNPKGQIPFWQGAYWEMPKAPGPTGDTRYRPDFIEYMPNYSSAQQAQAMRAGFPADWYGEPYFVSDNINGSYTNYLPLVATGPERDYEGSREANIAWAMAKREKNAPQDYFDRIAINGRGYSVPNQMLNFTDTGGVWPWEPMPSWYEPPAGLTNAQGWKEWNVGEGGATGDEPAGGTGGTGGTGGNGYGYGNWGGGYGASNYDSKPAYPTQGYKQDPNIYYQQLVKWVI